jgi:hypothetical protein
VKIHTGIPDKLIRIFTTLLPQITYSLRIINRKRGLVTTLILGTEHPSIGILMKQKHPVGSSKPNLDRRLSHNVRVNRATLNLHSDKLWILTCRTLTLNLLTMSMRGIGTSHTRDRSRHALGLIIITTTTATAARASSSLPTDRP